MFLCSFHCILLAALLTIAHAFMVETIEGSFVPWNLLRRAPGSIPVRLINNNDQAYLAAVMMGNPAQRVLMSASLSQNFISVASPPPGVMDGTYYNPAASSSSMPSGVSGTVQTISGVNATGRFVSETCTLTSTTEDFTYNAAVIVTDPALTSDMYPMGARGVLGYGINGPTDAPRNSSLLGVFLPANFTSAVCGIEINHRDDPVPDGIFTMGAVDTTAYTGDFTDVLVPSSSPTSWSVPLDQLTYLSSGGGSETIPGSLASIDIYHSDIQIPSDQARQIYASIPGSQPVSSNKWSVPCNSTFQMRLNFGGMPFMIYERDTIVNQPDGTCHGVVTGGSDQLSRVGAPFLRNVYTRFGVDKASNGSATVFVGFATKNERRSQTSTARPSQTTVTPSSVSTSATGMSGSGTIAEEVRLFYTLLIASVVAFAVWFH